MKTLLVIVSLLVIWPWSSGKKYHMTAASIVPAASGTVQVQKDETNGNMKLDIKVRNLANPASLTPSENAYVVWVRPKDEAAVKQGAIGVDKDLNGELKVVTTAKEFDVFITAEQSASVTMPSDIEILHAHVSP